MIPGFPHHPWGTRVGALKLFLRRCSSPVGLLFLRLQLIWHKKAAERGRWWLVVSWVATVSDCLKTSTTTFLTGFHSLSKSLVTRPLERQPDRSPCFFSPRKTHRNSETLRTGCPNSSPPHQGWPRLRAGTRKPDAPNGSPFGEPLWLAIGHWHENVERNQNPTSTRAGLSKDRELFLAQKMALPPPGLEGVARGAKSKGETLTVAQLTAVFLPATGFGL